jgi:hypothetical protein
MSFKTTAIVTALVAFALGSAYIFIGDLVVGRWHIEPTESVLLLGRRLGALYLGLAVIFFFARTAPVSVARTALSAGTAFALSALALLGIFEYASGRVGPGIFASVAIESLIALAYIIILFSDRQGAGHVTR